MNPQKKDIVLFINAVRGATFDALEDYEKRTGHKIEPVVLVDTKIQDSITKRNAQLQHAGRVRVINADFDSPTSVRAALKDIEHRIFAVTSQYENSVHELRKLVPYLPYLSMPTQSSLEWATEKMHMRDLLGSYDESLVPGYLQVVDASEKTIKAVEKKLNYPVVVKPSGLEGSLLVAIVHNRVQLKATLKHTFEEIQKAYDIWIKRNRPAILVEEFMEGDMYSVDTYVAHDGTCHHTPPVRVLTGHSVGFEDFFGYMRLTPTGLDVAGTKDAQDTAEKACHALNLRSVTVHSELMKTPHGWKVIELGPRIGGYRHDIYRLSYNINHIANDILIRAGEKPHIPTETLGSTALFNIYAREEGTLVCTMGEEIISALPSFVSIRKMLPDGSELKFAKNNGDPVFEVTLFNSDRDQLEKDIQKMEKDLIIEVAP